MSEVKADTIDQTKKTHKIPESIKIKIVKDLKEQKKRKEAWRKFSDVELAKKHGVTTSLLEYMKRNMK
jgi:hypothetical protein